MPNFTKNKARDYLLKNKKSKGAITTQQVMETNAYKNLKGFMKRIVKSYNNVKVIDNGVKILNNKGVERFEKEHKFSWANLLIIKELSNE